MVLELTESSALRDVQIASAFGRDAKDFAFCGTYQAKALAFRVLADRLEHGEEIPEIQGVFAVHE